MTLNTVLNLEEARIMEPKLSKEKVEKYKSLGIDGLLDEMSQRQRKGHFVEWQEYQGLRFPHIVDLCHRSRALYELGVREVELAVHIADEIGSLAGPMISGEISPLLKEAPLLEPFEYAKWYKEYNGETLRS